MRCTIEPSLIFGRWGPVLRRIGGEFTDFARYLVLGACFLGFLGAPARSLAEEEAALQKPGGLASSPPGLAAAPEPASAEPSRPPVDFSAGDRRMRAELAEISTSRLGSNPFVGPEFVESLRGQLAGLAPDATTDARSRLGLAVARTELWEGDNAEAIERLRTVVADADRLQDAALARLGRFWLGVAHLRNAEQQNCITAHTAESCIVPLEGRGVHANKEPARSAITVFTELLEMPGVEEWMEPAAAWLANIAYMAAGAYPHDVASRIRAEFFSTPGFPRFREVAADLGLDVMDKAGGVVVDDLDGDGFLDILFSTSDHAGELRLFLNSGDGRFVERTQEANLEGLPGGLNMVQADYDNDGDVDVLVLRGAWLGGRGRHPNSLLRNQGDGTFLDVTFAAGIGDVHFPTQTAAWADYDADGDLDLYIGNERDALRPGAEGFPDQLFRNRGDGTFEDVTSSSGLNNQHFTKAVVWGDYDDDGFPDLFVSNLHSPNRLFRNRGDGTFVDVAPTLGVDGPARSFGGWFWDYNNDGALDLFVSSYEIGDPISPIRNDLGAAAAGLLGRTVRGATSRLWRGTGDGTFVDVTETSGLVRVTLPMGLNFGDLDNDGFLDFYLATGYPGLEALLPNVMYQNENGRRFRDVTTSGGFGHLQKGHGVAFADLDNDGDQDVVNQVGGFYSADRFANAVYENPGFGKNWLRLQLVGTRSNRSAIGARVRVDVIDDGESRSIYRWVGSGGSFGCNPLRLEIGIGSAERVEQIEVRWPGSNEEQNFTGLEANRSYKLTEGDEAVVPLKSQSIQLQVH